MRRVEGRPIIAPDPFEAMRRPQPDDHALGRLLKLDREGILERCDEVLQVIYPQTRQLNQASRVSVRQKAGIDRVFRRLGLLSPKCCAAVVENPQKNGSETLSPRLLRNLALHARTCCTEAAPECDSCPLVSFCEMGARSARLFGDSRPAVIDVCAGAGALSRGFRREGFRVVLAVEKDRNAAQSYRVNNPGVPVVEADIRKVARDALALGPWRGRVTAVIGGPPCQGFK
jgi:hypothetical protein